jgi:membrane fusion protein (multidrug efflux system)
MFKILPTLYQAELDAKLAEVQSAQVELEQSKNLLRDRVVSQVDVTLHAAKLASAQAEAKRAEAELNFTNIKAPFDGIVDRLHEQLGSLVEEKDVLTTLSDNNLMWVYFNVPEARYLEYMASHQAERPGDQVNNKGAQIRQVGNDDEDEDEDEDEDDDDQDEDEEDGDRSRVAKKAGGEQREQGQEIRLVLADGSTFPHAGRIAAIEAQFNNETGNIPFRADFPNPERLLRHGQTGNVLIQQTLKNAILIPQRATFEILDKRYVYVIDENDVVHQREIGIQHELEDNFVIESGLDVNDKIVLDGVRQVHEGEEVEYKFLPPEEALANQKHHAE